MRHPGGKVAILGGGMAGLAAAWRLSEPGWQDRFESITVYQRGWRLGGKGASSRGVNGRIEEHGLHIWLGSYENAFGLLRECYAELDRATTDPAAPIRQWNEAMIPADDLGLADRWGDNWLMWLGTFRRNGRLPGDECGTGREMTAVGFVERALQLLLDFVDSQKDSTAPGLALSTSPVPPPSQSQTLDGLLRGIVAALLTLTDPEVEGADPADRLDSALLALRDEIDYDRRPDHRRSWLLISLVASVARGILVDKLVTDPAGFRSVNDEDFGQWIVRHGGHPDVVEFPLVRGVYDLVFGYEDADPERPAVAAGLMIYLIGLVLFEYKGAIFWKMTAGMGDVVIAPIYEVLRRRGVEFEFFHRLEDLHLDDARQSIDTISMTRQAKLVDGVDHYEPLTRVRGLPVFPSAPLVDQLAQPEPCDGWHSLETHWSQHAAGELRLLRRGVDFDHVVLAVSMGMLPIVAGELIEDRPEWSEMISHVRTIATQAFQLWLRPAEPDLGWDLPGVTVSAYERPFETWASMPQTLWAEDWPDKDRPGTVAYFCGSLATPWPVELSPTYAHACRGAVHAQAADYIETNLGLYFPKAMTEGGFAWNLLCGAGEKIGVEALATQHVSVNIDPSDRYVQSVPGSDAYRLRPDESGYDNLVLAGDWTDCGMNAGCIEAAVMSGLEAANVLLGRGRFHRVRGFYIP